MKRFLLALALSMTVLTALQQVYSGKHLTHPAVRSARAAEVQIRSPHGALSLELDGETVSAEDLTFKVQPGLLSLLA